MAYIAIPGGLQARAAAQFVQEANQYHSDLFLEYQSVRVNAKSIMGIMSLALSEGTQVKVIAEGNDETDAAQALVDFITNS
ncbi:HPr family phosphocarrier protein [Terrilactibacillus sp. BCM23-1]|uniref:HPr family phosphocarrier protein n=1 Tax=Terrilactibacillus tamarindi TaxID=2599694 RepID=A0A6N8CLJ4_9BACI|nr:HPr family phosphocarrier protein [Terrilactibacillus tamarindi]MTT30814.1 HPr family phosphocarrier protein [Terrilactibacillus tamarindi]